MKRNEIEVSFIYGSYASNKDTKNSDVDILILGNIRAKQLSKLLGNIPSARELNYSLMTSNEFRNRIAHNDPFIKRIVTGEKIYLKGDDEKLKEITG